MIIAAGAISILVVARGQRLVEVSARLSSANTALERQTQLIRAANQAGRLAGWSLGRAEGSQVVWSEGAERIFGPSATQTTSPDEVLDYVDAADRERLERAVLDCLRHGEPFVETFLASSGDGSKMWVTVMGNATRDEDGRIDGLAGAIQDVTAWKEAEATATAQRRRFTQFANAVPSIIWTSDPSGEIDYFNDALTDYTGRSPKTLLSDGWIEAVHPDDVASAVATWQRTLETGEPYETSFRIRRADGEYRWFRLAALPELDDDGRVVKWWGNAVDVHDARLLEERATELAAELEDILESIGDGVYTLDDQYRFTYLNSKAEELVQRKASEILGRVVWDDFPEAKGTEVEEAFDRARETRETQRFTTYNPALKKWFDVNANPTPLGLTVYFRDITELRSVSEQLAAAQRLESVGRLTGGVAARLQQPPHRDPRRRGDARG